MVFHCEILCIIWQRHFSRFLKNVFLIILEIRCLFVRSKYLRKYHKITLCIGFSFLDWFICGTFAKCIEITLQLLFVFVCYWDVFLISHNYVLYLFKVLLFLDDIIIKLNYGIVGTFELCMEVTLKNGQVLVTLSF